MTDRYEQEFRTAYEKAKALAEKVADRLPLPLHYILNAVFLGLWMGDLLIPDPIFLVDESLGAVLLWYYNAYLLRRTYGVINPMRILRGQSPAAKRKMGLLPYENLMDSIKQRLKELRRAAKSREVPGLELAKVKTLADQVKQLEKRLLLLDRLLTRPSFQEGVVTSEIARFEAWTDMTDDQTMKAEYQKAAGHARDHLVNLERLREERNRLVATLDRFRLQLDTTFSAIVAMSAQPLKAEETARLLDELVTAVKTFDASLQELEAKPAPDLLKEAMAEIEQTEEKFRGGRHLRRPLGPR